MRECPKCENCYSDEIEVCPHDQTATKYALPGAVLLAGRYKLEKRIGRGAMGQVYLARDENIGKMVAVKTVRQDLLNSDDLQEGEAIARFEREARAAASIRHPHCVDVSDFGKTEEGVFYLVMEYVEGETLHRLLRREGTLAVKRAVNLLAQIAEGVEAAHEAGILHRDLKPANIFIMKKRGSDDGFIKVGDFGLAKIVGRTVTDISSNHAPSSRGIIGTPEFMSPEQMQPELGVDVRADVYALGTIAYLMLGGKTPFTGDMMQLVMQKIMHAPPALATLRTDVPSSVERAIMRALEREPVKRPSSVAEWISELQQAARGVGEEETRGTTSRLVIMATVGAEVYIDDERQGSVGSSNRIILNNVPAGRHVLRVSKLGEKDDERVIEIREGANEQVIQAQLKTVGGSQPSPSREGGSSQGESSVMPGIVACPRCGAKLPERTKFCGRCGLNMTNANINSAAARSPSGIGQFSQNAPRLVERVCRRCNISFPPHIKFCGRCGLSLSS